MAILYTYPKTTPTLDDLLIATDKSNNSTRSFSVESVKDVIDVVDTFTNTYGTYIGGTTNTDATGNVSIENVDLNAQTQGGGRPDQGTPKFLRGDNIWAVIDAKDIEGGVLPILHGGTGTSATAFCNLSANTNGILPISKGGTGAGNANDGLNNLLPAQTGNSGKILSTDGTNTSWVDDSGITGTGASNLLAVWSGSNTLTNNTSLKYTQSTLENTSTGSFTGLRIRANNNTTTQGWNDELGAANFYNSNTSTNSTQIAINVPLKTGLNRAVDFYYNQNSGTGSIGFISLSNTAVSYNTSSDYRLKENIVDMTGAIDRVKQLKPKRFNFIVNPETTVDGLIAHEAAEVVPEAVSGEKDGEVYQGIDQSKLVPLLIGAIKELTQRIEALEA